MDPNPGGAIIHMEITTLHAKTHGGVLRPTSTEIILYCIILYYITSKARRKRKHHAKASSTTHWEMKAKTGLTMGSMPQNNVPAPVKKTPIHVKHAQNSVQFVFHSILTTQLHQVPILSASALGFSSLGSAAGSLAWVLWSR
jgi:hypothetical protein